MPTQKIRVAVVIDSKGTWAASGSSNSADHQAAEEAMIFMDSLLSNKLYFVHADIPIPQQENGEEIDGVIEDINGDDEDE